MNFTCKTCNGTKNIFILRTMHNTVTYPQQVGELLKLSHQQINTSQFHQVDHIVYQTQESPDLHMQH